MFRSYASIELCQEKHSTNNRKQWHQGDIYLKRIHYDLNKLHIQFKVSA